MVYCSCALFSTGAFVWAQAMPSDGLTGESAGVPWEGSITGYYYLLKDNSDFAIAIAAVDHGSLHLETRYNYEDMKTGSVFAGWTLSAGRTFRAEFTPMLGAAFGQTVGIVPAFELSLAYDVFDFYDESEYLFDLQDGASSYLYSWLELGVRPSEFLRLGLSAQRTRVIETPLEVERGVFLQMNPRFGSVSVYAFNLVTDHWFLILAVEISW